MDGYVLRGNRQFVVMQGGELFTWTPVLNRDERPSYDLLDPNLYELIYDVGEQVFVKLHHGIGLQGQAAHDWLAMQLFAYGGIENLQEINF